MRAAVRAKVEILRGRMAGRGQAGAAQEEAGSYFALAREFLSPPPPRLIGFAGLSGTGKSAVARAIAPLIGAFPGVVHVRSDAERKRLFGMELHKRLPARAYAPEISDQVYAVCRKRASMALQGGQAVILDAVHAKEEEREAAARIATELGVPFVGLWLEAPAETLRERVAARIGDVSDATPEVVDAQLDYDIGRQNYGVIDASLAFDKVVASCLARIAERSGAAP
jgi:predicted kinase